MNVGASTDQALTYDDNGNLTQAVNGSSVVTRKCEWDVENRLLAIQSAATPALGVKRSEFTYDGGGRRVALVEKEHNGTSWVTQSSWKYLWDGLELVQKRDASSGAILVNYFGSGEQQGGDAVVYQPDHLGSVRRWYRVSDGSQGSAEFSVWGTRSVIAVGPGVPERGYTGHLHHATTGLWLTLFRVYDPALGRWLSEDPIAEAGGVNLYAYVGNSPATASDPLGLFFIPASEAKGLGIKQDGDGNTGGEGLQILQKAMAGANAAGTGAAMYFKGRGNPSQGSINCPEPEPEPMPSTDGAGARKGPGGGSGRYRDVEGHHVHAKKGFEGAPGYDLREAFAVGEGVLKQYGVRHADITAAQQRLFREFAASGAPNTLANHSRIAYRAMVEAGIPPSVAKTLVIQSQSQLIRNGIFEPTRIPWGGR